MKKLFLLLLAMCFLFASCNPILIPANQGKSDPEIVPENPVDPETPDTPEDPEIPTDPDTPEDPEIPTDPDTPEDPDVPENPDSPEDPEDNKENQKTYLGTWVNTSVTSKIYLAEDGNFKYGMYEKDAGPMPCLYLKGSYKIEENILSLNTEEISFDAELWVPFTEETELFFGSKDTYKLIFEFAMAEEKMILSTDDTSDEYSKICDVEGDITFDVTSDDPEGTDPENPVNPETPDTPEDPETPETPTDPENPENPDDDEDNEPEVQNGTVTVTLDFDDIAVTYTEENGIYIFTASEGFENYEWTTESGYKLSGTNILTLNASLYPAGNYKFYLTAIKNGIPYSQKIKISKVQE